MLPQDPFWLSATIKENFRYGDLSSLDEEIIKASKIAGLHNFILQIPQGDDTMVGERGKRLCLGQRQLIAIARAVLSNPDILVLDEATASIDPQTEVLIQNSLENLMENRTGFVIAHRLSIV